MVGKGDFTGWPSGPCRRSVRTTAYSVFSSIGKMGCSTIVSVCRSYQVSRLSTPSYCLAGPSVSGTSSTPSKSVSHCGRYTWSEQSPTASFTVSKTMFWELSRGSFG